MCNWIAAILTMLVVSACTCMFLNAADQEAANEQAQLDQQLTRETRELIIDAVRD